MLDINDRKDVSTNRMGELREPKYELLAPAGSLECAKSAINAGADAIYMGGTKYGARAFAVSTKENSINEAIRLCHNNGKKFYLTVNTLFKQKELKEIFLFLDEIVEEGVDAFILQDLGVSQMLRDRYKNVELHASTQMTITSSKSINILKKLGFTRAILARELSIKEIKNIKKEVGDDIELEAFVHGSMCYSYSGTCLMSSFIGGESGNRGRCKGPCRLKYKNVSGKNDGEYLLSMKDMCALAEIELLMNAGIKSFKIEGRMRQAKYVEGVTKVYRKYIDCICKKLDDKLKIKEDEKYLLDLYNKGGFTNYYNRHNSYDMIQRYERK